LIDFDVEFAGAVSLSILVSEIVQAIGRHRSFYDAIIGFDEFEAQLRHATTFEELHDQLAAFL